MTRRLRRWLRRRLRPLLAFALFVTFGCSGNPEVAGEQVPECEGDGWLIAGDAPCVEFCAPEFYAFGDCSDPEGQRECVMLRSGQSAHVVKQGGLPFAELELFEEHECR